jgi:hypothetical protein
MMNTPRGPHRAVGSWAELLHAAAAQEQPGHAPDRTPVRSPPVWARS